MLNYTVPGGGAFSRFCDFSLATAAGDFVEGIGTNLDVLLFDTSYCERIALMLGSA